MTTIGYLGLDHHHCQPYLGSIDQLQAKVGAVCEPEGGIDPAAVGLGDIPHYHTAEELLTDADIDVLWITASNRETPDIIREAVDAGVDVYTEKPAGRHADEIDPIIDLVDDSDRTVCVSYAWRGHPISRELRERRNDGFYGDIRAINARFVASATQFRDTTHYLFDPAASAGGILQWLGIHWIDLIPWILDDPIHRVAASMSTDDPDLAVEEGAAVTLELESGAIGTLLAGYYLRADRYDTKVDIYGTDGLSRWDPMGAVFGFDDETSVELERITDDWSTPIRRHVHQYEPKGGYGGAWGLQFMEQFLDARNGDAPIPATLRDTRQVLAVLDAAYEAADTGEWVTVDRRD